MTERKKILLQEPMTLRGITVKNRIMVSPMCQYHSLDGGPTAWQLGHIGRLAVGGAGIVFGEETAVEARGRKTYGCAGIYSDDHTPRYRQLTDIIRTFGGTPAIQLGHAGRKGSCHGATRDWRPLRREDAKDGFAPWQCIAPSSGNDTHREIPPIEMDRDDIKAVLQAFADATKRSVDAGYEIVEVHGAHGYLIHQFLSPVANKRRDSYGGDRAGRMRFALEVVEVVRKALPPELPIFFRLSVVDGKGGVWGLNDSIQLSKELRQRDVDVIDVSSGGISGETEMPLLPRPPGYHTGFSERIRRHAGVKTVAVGGITDPHQAEKILQDGQADIIAVARELLWNGDWPAHALEELRRNGEFSSYPEEYAFRLRRRNAHNAMKFNQINTESNEVIEALYDSIPNTP